MPTSLDARRAAQAAAALAMLMFAALAVGSRSAGGTHDAGVSAGVRGVIADVALAALGVGLAAGLAVVAVALPRPHRRPRDQRLPRSVRRRGGAVALVLAIAALTPLSIVALRAADRPTHPVPLGASPTATAAPVSAAPSRPARGSGPASLVWLGGGVLVSVAVLLAVLVAPRRRARTPLPNSTPRPPRHSQAPASRWPDDPREIVLEAYNRSEACLQRAGLGRRVAEAPREFLSRLCGQRVIDRDAVARLTGLYEQARFSRHPISAAMSAQAREAYERLRARLERAC